MSKETGLCLSQSLHELLQVLPPKTEEKLVEGVSRCFGRGHFLPEEESTASAATLVRDLLQQLQKDPTRRHFVVDHDNLVTDDAAWLTLASCSSSIANDDDNTNKKKNIPLQWAITTVRSLERGIFEHCYPTDAWKIQHATGPRGSAVVTKRGALVTTDDTSTTSNIQVHQAFFSDMPKCVAATGIQLGTLYPEQCIVRVLRTAPRSSLTQGLTRVLQQPNVPSNVFTLWIRHHETISDLPGMGSYQYRKAATTNHEKNHRQSVLELLTEIVDEDEDAPTSPLAYDFVQASQASLQRCRPQDNKASPPPAIQPNFSFDCPKSKSAIVQETTTSAKDTMETALELPNLERENNNKTVMLSTSTSEVPNSSDGSVEIVSESRIEMNVNTASRNDSTVPVQDNAQLASSNQEVIDNTKGGVGTIPATLIGDKEEDGKESDEAIVAAATQKGDGLAMPREEKASEEAHEQTSKAVVSLLGSSENPTPLTHDPMGLAIALSGTPTASLPVDTRFDDLEILPSLSFDEADTKPSSMSKQSDNEKSSSQVDMEVPADGKVMTSNIEGSNPKETAVLPTETVAVNEQNGASETATCSEPAQAIAQQPNASSARNTKKVRCVGCGTKKAKSDFSNSQLKKKKNHRCLECVRANCLGPAGNQ